MIPGPMVEFLQTSVLIVVGTGESALLPECTRAWDIRVEKEA